MHSMFIEINSQSAAALFLLITINIECSKNFYVTLSLQSGRYIDLKAFQNVM